MNRIFFRFFVLVMLSITAATFVIYFAMSRLFGDPLEDIARRQASAQIFLLEQYIDKAPPDEWLVRLNKVREVSDARFDLMSLRDARAALSSASVAALTRGELVLDSEHKAFFRRVDLNGERYVGSGEEVLRVRELPIDIGLALKMEALRYVIVALALLVPIAMWSRSHWNGLQLLSKVADDFGAGKLSARAWLKPSASIYPLGERINHMANRIEGLVGAQRDLLHSVSHELRTPIARLEFALELLASKTTDGSALVRISAMEGDVAELNALVGELLSMTKLESIEQLDTAPVQLRALLRECADALPPSQVGLSCELSQSPEWIEADARLLARAIGNLLRNAQKYASSQIVLSARTDGPGRLEIVVEDDGPGIPPDQRERVFEPFHRLDRSRDRATGGFGLGLSIAHKAVALHGGGLRVEGARLGGARFVVTLPNVACRVPPGAA